jgi:hypothetical protein
VPGDHHGCLVVVPKEALNRPAYRVGECLFMALNDATHFGR